MILLLLCLAPLSLAKTVYHVLNPNAFQSYLDADDFKFALKYAPFFDSSDADLTEAFYFRIHSYRPHIVPTPKGDPFTCLASSAFHSISLSTGYIVTEFLPPVPWAQYYNAIPAAMGHHLNEGKWLRNTEWLNDYERFW
jgi:hypothetical protein